MKLGSYFSLEKLPSMVLGCRARQNLQLTGSVMPWGLYTEAERLTAVKFRKAMNYGASLRLKAFAVTAFRLLEEHSWRHTINMIGIWSPSKTAHWAQKLSHPLL